MMFHDVSMSSAGILEVKDSELQEVRVSLSGIQDSDWLLPTAIPAISV